MPSSSDVFKHQETHMMNINVKLSYTLIWKNEIKNRLNQAENTIPEMEDKGEEILLDIN